MDVDVSWWQPLKRENRELHFTIVGETRVPEVLGENMQILHRKIPVRLKTCNFLPVR